MSYFPVYDVLLYEKHELLGMSQNMHNYKCGSFFNESVLLHISYSWFILYEKKWQSQCS
jgi:hypothetical protein